MYVRLAFAVAAHLESEILIVDEVLAVGDAEFQKKCLGKMGDVSKGEGRTVLFVSHNMAAVKELCNQGILLNQGRIEYKGSALETVIEYQKGIQRKTEYVFDNEEQKLENNNIKIISFKLINNSKKTLISFNDNITIELVFENKNKNINLAVAMVLKNYEEVTINEYSKILSENNDSKKGIYTIRFEIPSLFLNSGSYYFNILFAKDQRYLLFDTQEIINFQIENETIGSNSNPLPGILRLGVDYEINFKNYESFK